MISATHKTSSEPNTKTRTWSYWFNIRIRQYMIMEIFFFISLFMIFYRLQTLSNQNDRVLEMVSTMERKLEALQLASQKPDHDISKFDSTKPQEQDAELSNMKKVVVRCTDDQNPVLTIDLAKLVKPISVSYQHSEWNETIPSEAPKTYDVVACLDYHCKLWKPLASNCHYSQYEPNGAEQICNISSDLDAITIGKVQFRYRENYGNPGRTCVSLVRVYGETKKPVKMEKHLNSQKTCADLKWFYHNSYIGYAFVS
ncbi:unnamed protein product [Caenorhabditis nigoni]